MPSQVSQNPGNCFLPPQKPPVIMTMMNVRMSVHKITANVGGVIEFSRLSLVVPPAPQMSGLKFIM